MRRFESCRPSQVAHACAVDRYRLLMGIMPESEPKNTEVESQGRRGISKVGATAMGLAWGLVTFEGGTALYHFLIDNHDSIGEYTIKGQAEGVALFGVGGAIALGRFIYKQVGN